MSKVSKIGINYPLGIEADLHVLADLERNVEPFGNVHLDVIVKCHNIRVVFRN